MASTKINAVAGAILAASKDAGVDVSTDAVGFVLGYAAAQRKVREGQNTSLMILPRFTVIDKSKAEPIMAEFVKKTRNEAGCLYYGWSLCGDQLVCEEIYLNAAAVAAHLQNIGPQIGQITAEGVAKMDSIELHGPAGEVEKCKKLFDPLGAKYFITDSSVTNMRGYASKIASRPLDIVLIRPYFTVLDWDKARPIMAEFVRRTGTEGRMVFYGWDIDGDTLYCREGYRDGDAANAHLKNVGTCLGELVAEGVAKLNSIAIHGPAAELEKVKPGTEKFGTKYYAIHSGFQQYA